MSKLAQNFIAFWSAFTFAVGYTIGHYAHLSHGATATVWGIATVYGVGFLVRYIR